MLSTATRDKLKTISTEVHGRVADQLIDGETHLELSPEWPEDAR
jgi:hypothetical protein